jgi:hypothetical protein
VCSLIKSQIQPTEPFGTVRYFQEDMGTETKGSALAIYHDGKTHNHLCCHGVVAKDEI